MHPLKGPIHPSKKNGQSSLKFGDNGCRWREPEGGIGLDVRVMTDWKSRSTSNLDKMTFVLFAFFFISKQLHNLHLNPRLLLLK